jgi:signal peptidase I
MANLPKTLIGWLYELKFALFGAALVFLAETALAQPYIVPSSSMEPTLLVGDEIVASKFAYGYSKFSPPFGMKIDFEGRIFSRLPERGDVVVFALPRDPAQTYVKRVIGLPGDRVQLKNGDLYINGEAAPRRLIGSAPANINGQNAAALKYMETLPNGREHEILKLSDGGHQNNTREFVTPPGCVFVMGDNRDDSLDSRVSSGNGGVGFVPAENLIGRADRVLFSLNPIGQWRDVVQHPAELRISRVMHPVE